MVVCFGNQRCGVLKDTWTEKKAGCPGKTGAFSQRVNRSFSTIIEKQQGSISVLALLCMKKSLPQVFVIIGPPAGGFEDHIYTNVILEGVMFLGSLSQNIKVKNWSYMEAFDMSKY